jgi:type II secretory pathway component GspD/PulD (secretin)
MEIRDQPVSDVLALVARRMDVNVTRDGKLFFVGALRPEDRGLLVRRVRRLRFEELEKALEVFQGENGRSAAFSDGLLVVGDTVEILKRVDEMLTALEATEAPCWIVQLHIVGYTQEAADELGINVEPAARAGVAFATGSAAATVESGLNISASLDAVLQVAHSRSDVSVTASPMFLLCDGSTGEFVQGDRVPVPKRTVSDAGTVTISGYEFIQTGVEVNMTLREMSPESARVDLEVGMSDLKRLVEEAPVTGEERFKTSAVVQASGVYLIGTLVKDRRQRENSLGWQSGSYSADSSQVVQVWLQSYRIGSEFSLRPMLPDSGQVTPDPVTLSVDRDSETVGAAASVDGDGWQPAANSSE